MGEKVVVTKSAYIFQLVYNNLRSEMEQQEGEWQGFQSFNEDHCKLHFSRPQQAIQKQQMDPVPGDNQLKMATLRKKLTFRAKNKRKGSFANNPNPKKNTSHLQLSTLSAGQPQKTLIIERPKRILMFDRKDEGIPIFHHASQRVPEGTILFKRQPLATAEQELRRNGRRESPLVSGEEVRFESRFESGNLQQVVRVGSEHHLFLAADTNTRGHRQWFFFTVVSTCTRKVKMVVHSFRKRMSLYQIGMRPYGKRADEGDEAWKPVGCNVRYGREVERGRRAQISKQMEFCLSFEIELQKDLEFCIASCIPYSFSFLKQRLQFFLTPSQGNKVSITEQTLCKTLTGLPIPILTINQESTSRPHRYIIINARTHPGESSSSWVLDGLLRELVNSSMLQGLLAEFAVVVKVVPMLNVEGVCLGNYRTGTMGMDFNRIFLTGSPDLFPQVAALKRMVEECKTKGRVDLFLDLHGHSILPGCFMYGPDPLFAPQTALGRLVREMGKSRYFMRAHCVQGVDSAKAETSRIYFQVQQGVFSLTCENSLGLFCKNGQKGKEVQFEAKDWQDFGKDLITIILNIYDEYCDDQRGEKSEMEEMLNFINTVEEEEFVWDKANTDTGMMQDDLRMLNQLQVDEVDLPREHLTLSQGQVPQDHASQDNDSDGSSEDLPLQKQQELIKMVRKTLAKQAPPPLLPPEPTSFSPLPTAARDTRPMSHSRIINNFKEYRFGVEDPTITDWYTRKRLFSVPKHLKNQRQGQSYLIRKKTSLSGNSELASEPMQITKRVRTQEREKSTKELASRQKVLLENLLLRRG